MTVYDDGRLETRTTTQNFDGRGGTRTETFDGDNSSIREYDRQGRATRKEDSSLSATLTEISRGSEHPHDDHEGGDPSPSPNDEGTGSDTGDSANLARRLERLLERSKSISGMLRSYLGSTAHPQWDGQVDPNTGLGPLEDSSFAVPQGAGTGQANDNLVDPNTGIDALLYIDLSRISTQATPNDELDPNTGLDGPPVHSGKILS